MDWDRRNLSICRKRSHANLQCQRIMTKEAKPSHFFGAIVFGAIVEICPCPNPSPIIRGKERLVSFLSSPALGTFSSEAQLLVIGKKARLMRQKRELLYWRFRINHIQAAKPESSTVAVRYLGQYCWRLNLGRDRTPPPGSNSQRQWAHLP